MKLQLKFSEETNEIKPKFEETHYIIPNEYGVALKLLEEESIIQLLGKDGKVLSEIDLPTEELIRNVEYINNKLYIYWQNGQSTEIDLSNLVDVYKAGDGISISADGTISVNYPNGDEITYG